MLLLINLRLTTLFDNDLLFLLFFQVEMMESKVKSELSALTENLWQMQNEMARLSDLEGLKTKAETFSIVSCLNIILDLN